LLTDETLSIIGYPVLGTFYATGVTNNIPAGWHHFAAAWGASSYFVYIDGVSLVTMPSLYGHVPLQVGTNYYFVDRTTAPHDDIRSYGRSLSASEVETIYRLKGRDTIRAGLHFRVRGSKRVGTGATYPSGQTWTVEGGGTVVASNNVVAAETIVGDPAPLMEY